MRKFFGNDGMNMSMYDVIIIGGGVAGLSAAMYSGRLEVKTLLLAEMVGGNITLADVVENYPGFNRISGLDLADKLRRHVEDYDVEIKEEKVIKTEPYKDCFKVTTTDNVYRSKTIIFATGTRHRELNVPGEKEFKNRGVHDCALCDGPFYKDKTIAVVGGSDSAAKEALLLAEYAKKVYIIYRGDRIRPEPINRKRVYANPKIEVITNTNIIQIKGESGINKILLDRPYEGSRELDLDGVFLAIGSIPLSELAKEMGVRTNEKGEIIIDSEAGTNIKGVFAAGDVTNREFKQAIIGVAEGVIASYSAYRYVNEHEIICPNDA